MEVNPCWHAGSYNSSEQALFNGIGCWKMVQEEEGGLKVIFFVLVAKDCWLEDGAGDGLKV